jgi:hypothetical protein
MLLALFVAIVAIYCSPTLNAAVIGAASLSEAARLVYITELGGDYQVASIGYIGFIFLFLAQLKSSP